MYGKREPKSKPLETLTTTIDKLVKEADSFLLHDRSKQLVGTLRHLRYALELSPYQGSTSEADVVIHLTELFQMHVESRLQLPVIDMLVEEESREGLLEDIGILLKVRDRIAPSGR